MEGQIVKTNVGTKKSEKRQLYFYSLEISNYEEKYLNIVLSLN